MYWRASKCPFWSGCFILFLLFRGGTWVLLIELLFDMMRTIDWGNVTMKRGRWEDAVERERSSAVHPALLHNGRHPLLVLSLVFLIELCSLTVGRAVGIRLIQQWLWTKAKNLRRNLLYTTVWMGCNVRKLRSVYTDIISHFLPLGQKILDVFYIPLTKCMSWTVTLQCFRWEIICTRPLPKSDSFILINQSRWLMTIKGWCLSLSLQSWMIQLQMISNKAMIMMQMF